MLPIVVCPRTQRTIRAMRAKPQPVEKPHALYWDHQPGSGLIPIFEPIAHDTRCYVVYYDAVPAAGPEFPALPLMYIRMVSPFRAAVTTCPLTATHFGSVSQANSVLHRLPALPRRGSPPVVQELLIVADPRLARLVGLPLAARKSNVR